MPAPGFSSALAYYDALASDRLPASLIQGQRDFFGAHTYKRVDRDGTYHTLWGGDRRERGPASLIQGLRDLFGAHTYRRVDDEGAYHVRWGQDGSEVRTDE